MELKTSYSGQFREEVMEYIDGFHSQDYVAKLFGLSPKTVWNLVQQRKEVGYLESKKTSDRKHRKLEKETLLQYVKDNLSAFLREIAAHFSEFLCCKAFEKLWH
jgi:transposase